MLVTSTHRLLSLALILGFWRECAKLFSVDGSGNINRLEMFALLDALGMSNLTDDEVEELVRANYSGISFRDGLSLSCS